MDSVTSIKLENGLGNQPEIGKWTPSPA